MVCYGISGVVNINTKFRQDPFAIKISRNHKSKVPVDDINLNNTDKFLIHEARYESIAVYFP